DHVERRVAMAGEDHGVREHAPIGLEAEAERRKEEPAVAGEQRRVAERREEHIEEGIERHHDEREHERDVSHAEQPLSPALFQADASRAYHRLESVSRLLIRFAARSRPKLMTELKSPTAALNEKSACGKPQRDTDVEIKQGGPH